MKQFIQSIDWTPERNQNIPLGSGISDLIQVFFFFFPKADLSFYTSLDGYTL